MSYIERASYDYLKSTIFSGLRILLSRRFIIFTILLVIMSFLSTGTIILQGQNSSLITDDFIDFVMLVQTSVAIGFILTGLLSKRLPIFFRLIIMISTFIIFQIFFLISQEPNMNQLSTLRDLFVEILPILCFFSWCIMIPISTFAFSKGLFSNNITGTILFLGKQKTDHNAIFSGVMALIAIFSLLWNVFLAYQGFIDNKFSYLLMGSTGLILAIIIILIVRGKIFRNDIINSTIGLFFVVSIPNQLFIVLSSIQSANSIISTINYLLVFFSVIFTAQNVAKRVKIKGIDTRRGSKTQKGDPFGLGRTIGFIGGEGIVLISFGLYLGYNLVQLQSMAGLTSAYNLLFGDLTFGEVYHDISHLCMILVFAILVLTFIFRHNHPYFSDDIHRFDFLPPYDDLVDYLERIKSGEITTTDLVLSAGKKAIEKGGHAASAGIFSAITKFSDKIRRTKPKE